jgi:ribosome modulation factor
MPLPSNFLRWNRALRGAFLKGAAAHLAGENLGACPYDDKRKPSGRLSWSRAFRNAWRDGWEYARADRADALITLAYMQRI